MFLACSLILTAVVVLLCVVARKAKLPIRHRVLHIRYVIPTIIFSITTVFTFSKILQLINNLLYIPFLRKLLFAVTPSSNVSAGFFWIISLLCCILIMVFYCLFIHLLQSFWVEPLSHKNYLASRSFLEKFMNAIAGLFYNINDETAVLPPKKANVGQWFRVMRIIFAVILLAQSLFVGLYLQFDWSFLGDEFFVLLIKSGYMIPLISYIILEQIELFFAADAKDEKPKIDTEEIGSSMYGSFSELTDLYNRVFGTTSLIAHYTGSGKGEVQRELFSGIQAEQKERVENPALLEALCRNVECVTAPASHYVNGLVDLINGMNVAVFDTLWGEFDAYYLSYIQHRLTLNNTVLVLCDTDVQVEQMKKRITSVYKKMNIADCIWRIRDLDSLIDGETDILICTEEQLLANPLNIHFPLFNKNLKVVVMLDSYGLLCRETSFYTRLFDFFQGREMQFVFYLPENNTDLRKQLQKLSDDVGVSFCENSHTNNQTNMMLWREESVFKPQHIISPRLYHDFGTAYTIAIIAAMYDVETVHILSPETIPCKTYHNLVTKEYAKIIAEDYFKRDSINLSSVIRNNDYSATDPTALSFCIVHDENNNLINIAKTWLSYGGEISSMLHIVSAPYMLRDYFAKNIDSLCTESTGLQLLIPNSSLSLRAPAIALLIRMRHSVSCKELISFAKNYREDAITIESILEDLLTAAFGKTHRYNIYNCFSFTECKKPDFKDDRFIYDQTITLVDEDMYLNLCKLTEKFVTIKGAYNSIIPIHKSDVYNRFLPKQSVTFGNLRYIIEDINDGVLTLTPEETVEMERYYTPLYSIPHFEKIRDFDNYETISTSKMSTSFFEAKITRETTAYYSYPGMLDITDTALLTKVNLSRPITETKTASCLELTLKCPFDDCSDKIANTLCFLLRGAMESFLPKNHKDLLILSKIDKSAVKSKVMFKAPSGLLEDPIPSDVLDEIEYIDPAICDLIPDVTSSDMKENTTDAIHLYIAHFSESDTGILTSIASNLERILLTVSEYLKWAEGQTNPVSSYLRFGYKSTPEIFDSVGTLFCLSSIVARTKITEREDTAVVEIDSATHCDFCGKGVAVSYHRLDDGRIMCQECHSHITDSREEIEVLLKTAIETLEKNYDITLPKDIKLKFKSATAIRKRCGISGLGRVLGFYNLKRHEIWIERKGPMPCVLSTLIHELTHAWQHANTKVVDLKILEGHSSYVEVECMRLLKQNIYADFITKQLNASDDVYGEGFRYWRNYMRLETDKNIFHHILML